MLNREHWRQVYAAKSADTRIASPFAQWCRDSWGLKGCNVLDLGCGDGRDTFFLRSKNEHVVGVDPFAPAGKDFWQGTATDFIRGVKPGAFQAVYCRFLFHSIEGYEMRSILDFCKKERAKLYTEFRITGDVPQRQDHERRLIQPEDFVASLLDRGLKLEYLNIGRGMAQYGSEDPLVMRAVTRER